LRSANILVRTQNAQTICCRWGVHVALNFAVSTGALELFSDILATPGQDSCYVEICKLVWQLLYEPDNRMPIYKSPLMDHLKNMRTLQRWKGSAVAVIAKDSIAKLEKHAERVRKMEKKQKKENRQQEAANRLKKINAAASPTSSSPRSPNTISPEQSQESLVGSQLSQVSIGSIEPTQADKHKRHLRKRGQGSPNNSDISLESDAKEVPSSFSKRCQYPKLRAARLRRLVVGG
jgi:hypothetical protein